MAGYNVPPYSKSANAKFLNQSLDLIKDRFYIQAPYWNLGFLQAYQLHNLIASLYPY